MMRLPGLFAVMIFAASCQTYDFERVVPLAVAQTTDKKIIASKRLKPNVMMLVDNSGSMLLPTNPSLPACPANCGQSQSNLCPPNCPTRTSELKSAMGTFLQSSGTIARFGLTIFPSNSTCGASTDIRVPFPNLPALSTDEVPTADLTDAANQVNMRIQGLGPTGGTPTGASLQFVGTYSPLTLTTDANNDFRDDFVLLLTDGLPNCNADNPNKICGCYGPPNNCTPAQNTSCDCTLQGGCANSYCSQGCLDQDGAVGNVKALRLLGIRTIVVGFGADTASGNAPLVLNAMAREGGFARECPMGTDTECGGSAGSCNTATKQCTTSFFQASNGTELTAALQKISQSFQGDPCVFTLSAHPSDPRYLSVVIDGQSIAAGTTTYSYDFNSNKVTFLGALCTQLTASTAQTPVSVEFRIVERL